jgi:hypothetical protein
MRRTSSPAFRQPGVRAVLALILFALAGTVVDTAAAQSPLPSLAEVDDGWTTIRPGGETICAHGDEYRFWARLDDPTRLAVYLYGGGGCWDAETCEPERSIRAQHATFTYVSTIEPARHPARQSGILDLEHPDNPVAGYSMVAVPVCTGDAFLGDRDVTYTLETESGTRRQFTIHHRGQTNTMAVMDWIRSNFEQPAEIVVAGSSAGALGTPLYASLLAQHYPSARVIGLGDDGGSLWSGATGGVDPGTWGIPDVLRGHPGWEGFHASMRVEHLYITAAQSAPNLKLYQFNHAHDARQRYYLELAGAEDLDVLQHIRANRRALREQVPEFRSFMVGGFLHTVLNGDRFYHYQSTGHRLRDWVAAIARGEPVASVDCGEDCLRPGLVYGDQDLRIVDRAIELLSAPGAWNPREAPGRCPAHPDNHTLRCAAVQAEREVTGQTPAGLQNVPPALWDIVYTAALRLGDRAMNDPLRRYNDHPETTAADMISLLEEVRVRIEGELGRASQDSRVSEIIELNRRIMHQQIIERDPTLFQEVSFDQFLVVAPGGRIENKAEAVAGVSGWDVESIEVRDEQVIFQGNTAVLVGRLQINGIMRPVGSLPPMKFMAVFVETGDGWKLLARSQTPCFEIAIDHGFC